MNLNKRLHDINDAHDRAGAAAAAVFYLALEGLAFFLLLAVWYFGWLALPADAAELAATASHVAKGSIILGTMLLAVAYLMLRAVRPKGGK